MRTVDQCLMRAPLAVVFPLAADVERWPDILSHYRWVRVLDRQGDARAEVEMAARRPFGPVGWPTWWASDMIVDRDIPEVRYRHLRGVTRGMDVVWSFAEVPDGTMVTIVHEWDGPSWPLIRRPAAEWIIGPVFIHGIASRTLAGIARAAAAR